MVVFTLIIHSNHGNRQRGRAPLLMVCFSGIEADHPAMDGQDSAKVVALTMIAPSNDAHHVRFDGFNITINC